MPVAGRAGSENSEFFPEKVKLRRKTETCLLTGERREETLSQVLLALSVWPGGVIITF